MRHPFKFSEIISFGDSLHDAGNSFALTFGLIPPLDLYFSGRFTNGFVAIEQLSEILNFPQNPFYDDFSGNNFAVGGSRTGRDNSNNDNLSPFGIVLPGLADQIDAFLGSINRKSADPHALYSLWVGPNDYLDYLAGIMMADPAILIDESIDNIVSAINRLREVKANQFLIPNMSLGRLPFSSNFRGDAIGISRAFNAALALALDNFDLKAGKKSKFYEVDIFSATEKIAQDPSIFGFSNITDPFLVPGVTEPDPEQTTGFFFWDMFHPTGEGHAVFADLFLKTLKGKIPKLALKQIQGTSKKDFLRGSRKADNIDGFSGSDIVYGRKGDDRIEGWNGADLIFGNRGSDIISGGRGKDKVFGGDDNDVIFGGNNKDKLFGNSGDDVVVGDDGNDWIKGGSGRDYLLGGRGDDTLWGQGHTDILIGGDEHDFLWGGYGNDELEGGKGNDTLIGSKGVDIARYRSSVDDYIFKGNPNDIRVIGPEGRDRLKSIESLKFTEGIIDADKLTFLPTPLYDRTKKVEAEIPVSGDAVDIYYPVTKHTTHNNDSLPVALFLQGANVDKSNYTEFSKVFASYGFAVVVPNNLRSISPPPPAPPVTGFFPELPQVNQVLDYVRDPGLSPIADLIDSEKLVLLGHSFGGAVGLSAVQGGCPFPMCPFGEFEQPDELVGAAFFGTSLKPPPNIGGGEVPPIDNADIPTALILGTNDGVTLPEDTRATFEAIQNPPKALIEVKDTNHFGITDSNFAVNPPETPPEVPPIALDREPQELPQLVAINEIATWSAQFLRATILDDDKAFDFVFAGTGDNLDRNVEVTAQLPMNPLMPTPCLLDSVLT